MHPSVRVLLATAAALGLEVGGGDFGQAYINSDLDRKYYMWPPMSAEQYDEDGDRIVWFVVKSLYGGKQSGRNWYLLLRSFMVEQGFTPSDADPCVFIDDSRISPTAITCGIRTRDLSIVSRHSYQ